MPRDVDPRIVILDIDEKSLAAPELGQWPWGRDVVAGLVAKLFDKYGVAILGFDVVFAEPDRSSGLRVLDGLANGPLKDVPDFQAALAELRPRLDHDAQFVQTIKGRPVVLGYYLTSDRDARTTGVLPPPVLEPGTFANRPIEFTSWTGYGANLPDFQAAAASDRALQPGRRRRRHQPPRADARRVQGRVLRAAVARGDAHAARVPEGGARLPAGERPQPQLRRPRVARRRAAAHPGRRERVLRSCPYRGAKGSFRYVSLADVYTTRSRSRRSRARSRSSAPPRRVSSTCARRRWAPRIRGSRSTPTSSPACSTATSRRDRPTCSAPR